MNSKSILTLSIILNLGMLGAVGYYASKAPASVAPVAVSETKTNTHTKMVQKKSTTVVTNETASQMFDWRSVESADYKEYIANLRSIGCPEETIKDIIMADVNKLFESRKKALKSAKKFEFWKSGNMFAGMVDEEQVKQNQELAKEKRALLKELLGIEPEEKADMAAIANPLTTMLDFLPDDKQAKVSELLQNYQAKAMKAMKGGAPDAEDMKEIQKVQKDMDTELAKVLSPQEYEDYQLRLSQTSMMMRMQLGTFEPSEQEFRDIFKLKKSYDDEYGIMGMSATDKAEREKSAAAKKETEAQIKTILGEQRYAEYERSQDYGYQGLVKITDRNQLSRDVANKAYDMDKVSKDQIKDIRANKSLTAEKREEAIKAVRDETDRSMKQILGDKAFESYSNRRK